MPSQTTALTHTTHHDPLPPEEAQRLARALDESADATVFVNGTTVRLSPGATSAVRDLLARLARGEAVTISTSERFLNTSQAAQLAGVSNTYMRNLTDSGAIPVEYRGTHRRIRPADVQAWVDARNAERAEAARREEAQRGTDQATSAEPGPAGKETPAHG